MQCTRLIFMSKKHLNTAILKSNLSKHPSFRISQKLLWMETDTQKLTKSHFQPSNHCSLKIYQPRFIDDIRCNPLGCFYGKNASQYQHFKVKLKQTSVFLDFSKLLLDGNCYTKVDET